MPNTDPTTVRERIEARIRSFRLELERRRYEDAHHSDTLRVLDILALLASEALGAREQAGEHYRNKLSGGAMEECVCGNLWPCRELESPSPVPAVEYEKCGHGREACYCTDPTPAPDVARVEVDAVLTEFGIRRNDCDHKRRTCEEVGCEFPTMARMAATITALRQRAERAEAGLALGNEYRTECLSLRAELAALKAERETPVEAEVLPDRVDAQDGIMRSNIVRVPDEWPIGTRVRVSVIPKQEGT